MKEPFGGTMIQAGWRYSSCKVELREENQDGKPGRPENAKNVWFKRNEAGSLVERFDVAEKIT